MAAALEEGWVDPVITADLPGLGVASRVIDAPADLTEADPGVVLQLGMLAGRMRGARAVELRREAVPAAYRVTFRHLGIDPDLQRTPIEDAVVGRLVQGGYSSRGRLDDALLLALVETSVAVLALDADAISGAVGLRAARRGERLGHGSRARPASGGRLALCDDTGPIAELFGEVAGSALPSGASQHLRLLVVRIPGVPQASIDEALWICEEALGVAPAG